MLTYHLAGAALLLLFAGWCCGEGEVTVNWCTTDLDCGSQGRCHENPDGSFCTCKAGICHADGTADWVFHVTYGEVDCMTVHSKVVHHSLASAFLPFFRVPDLQGWECYPDENVLAAAFVADVTVEQVQEMEKTLIGNLTADDTNSGLSANGCFLSTDFEVNATLTRKDGDDCTTNTYSLRSVELRGGCFDVECKEGAVIVHASEDHSRHDGPTTCELQRTPHPPSTNVPSPTMPDPERLPPIPIRWCVDDTDCQAVGDRNSFCIQGECACHYYSHVTVRSGNEELVIKSCERKGVARYLSVIVHMRFPLQHTTVCKTEGFFKEMSGTVKTIQSAFTQMVVMCTPRRHYDLIVTNGWSYSDLLDKWLNYRDLPKLASELFRDFGLGPPVVSFHAEGKVCTAQHASYAAMFNDLCIAITCEKGFVAMNGTCLANINDGVGGNTTKTTLSDAWSSGLLIVVLVTGVILASMCLFVTAYWSLRRPRRSHRPLAHAPPPPGETCLPDTPDSCSLPSPSGHRQPLSPPPS